MNNGKTGKHSPGGREWRPVKLEVNVAYSPAPDYRERLHRVMSILLRLLRIYAPRWEHIDARDLLVAWAAARLALTRAKCELRRYESLRRPLTRRELDAKGGRQADVSFWGRLSQRLETQVPAALAEDAEAKRVLVRFLRGKHGESK